MWLMESPVLKQHNCLSHLGPKGNSHSLSLQLHVSPNVSTALMGATSWYRTESELVLDFLLPNSDINSPNVKHNNTNNSETILYIGNCPIKMKH